MDIEVIADYGNVVGEGPTWDPRERRLYWIDIPNGRIFRYDPASGEHAQIYDGPMMGGFTMQQDGSLLLFMERGAIAVLRDGKLEYVVDELPGEDGNRFNDVIADPAGRVFGGTMPVDTERRDGRRERRYPVPRRHGRLDDADHDGGGHTQRPRLHARRQGHVLHRLDGLQDFFCSTTTRRAARSPTGGSSSRPTRSRACRTA